MNLKKIGLFATSLSLLTTVGLICGNRKAEGVKAEDPEPITLDMHQEAILDRLALRLNDTHDDWETIVTDWINDPEETIGIKFFNMDIDAHTYSVSDIDQVKRMVYIEYLFINYYFDTVDLPNREIDTHQYKSGIDYIRETLDDIIEKKDDIKALFEFDYTATYVDTNPDDITTVTKLVNNAHNIYKDLSEIFYDNYSADGELQAPFFMDATGALKGQLTTMSDYFNSTPGARESEEFNSGRLALRLYKLLTYTVYDEHEDCPEMIHPLTADELSYAYNTYFEVKESYETDYGSWFSPIANVEEIKNLFFNIESYSNFRGLISVLYFVDALSYLREDSNVGSTFAEYFLNNYGPVLYKLIDLLVAVRDKDIPNIIILGKEVIDDTQRCIAEFYAHCVQNFANAGDEVAGLLICVDSDLVGIINSFCIADVSDPDFMEFMYIEAIMLQDIRDALGDYPSCLETSQFYKYLDYVTKKYDDFRESIRPEFVDAIEDELYDFLENLGVKQTEVKSMDLEDAEDLAAFRHAVFNTEKSYDDYQDELGKLISTIGLPEEDFIFSLLSGTMQMLDFKETTDAMDADLVEALDREVDDELLTIKVELNDIASIYEDDIFNIDFYLKQVGILITDLKNLEKYVNDSIIHFIDDGRFDEDITNIQEATTAAEALKVEVKALYDEVEAQLEKQEEDYDKFLERYLAIVDEYSDLLDVEINSPETYENACNDFADIGIKMSDLGSEVEQYMDDDDFIDVADQYSTLIATLYGSFITIEMESSIVLEEFVTSVRLDLSNKLAAVKATLESINAKYADDTEHLRAYREEVNAELGKLDLILIEAGEYDEVFIYDTCMEDLIEDINNVYDDGEELKDNINNLMADSEILRLVALSNSFDDDIEFMENHKDNGMNYKGNMAKCDEIIDEMNAAIQNIDDNMEILDYDQRLVNARAKLVSGVESINASKQAIQREHTTMLVLVIVLPIVFVIAVLLLLYFFGFKKRFLRRDKAAQ